MPLSNQHQIALNIGLIYHAGPGTSRFCLKFCLPVILLAQFQDRQNRLALAPCFDCPGLGESQRRIGTDCVMILRPHFQPGFQVPQLIKPEVKIFLIAFEPNPFPRYRAAPIIIGKPKARFPLLMSRI